MTAAGGPVDAYLDEMFTLLAGTGANGRRLLIEAEQHLTEAAAEGRARGLDAEAAEREAVDRFGPAAAVARRVPAGGTLRVSLPRLAIGAWALAGAVLIWYGLSGALTWLLSWPWTALLIATDRFGRHPMCEHPWVPEVPIDCLAYNRHEASLLVGTGNEFPYLVTAGVGVALAVALVILRRATVIGGPSWTPPRTASALTFAVLFGLGGVALLIEAADGITKDVQYYVLADLVAGSFALVIAAVAVRSRRPAAACPEPARG